jgi:TolB-like protein
MSLFSELKRRNVFRVSIAYLVGTWALLQIVDVVAPILVLPPWVGKLVLFLLALGFIPTLLISWAYEVTPEGLKRESEIDRDISVVHQTARKLDFVTIGLVVLALTVFALDRYVLPRTADNLQAEREVAARDSTSPVAPASVDSTPSKKASIAILPFASRSSRDEDQFFTDGIHDDVLTHLANIGSMKVISRTSVMRYRDTDIPIPEIASELGVKNILEGSIQRAGKQVRITVQLIEAATDDHLWAASYDRELTAENLFAIQTEISREVAEALQLELTGAEQSRISRIPTKSLEAYQAYLLGRDQFRRRSALEFLDNAIEHFNIAIDLEPDYAEAYSGLAAVYVVITGYQSEPDLDAFDKAKALAEKAIELNPELAEPYAVLGLYYRNIKPSGAMLSDEYLTRAVEMAPNNATIHLWQGTSRMILGHLERAHESLLIARELDPAGPLIAGWLAEAHVGLGDYPAAMKQYRSSVDIGGISQSSYLLALAELQILTGDIAAAEMTLTEFFGSDAVQPWLEVYLPARLNGENLEEARALIEALNLENQYNDQFSVFMLAALGANDAALDILFENADVEDDIIKNAWLWPYFDGVRKSPRFKELLEHYGLPDAWRQTGWPKFCRPVGGDDFACE